MNIKKYIEYIGFGVAVPFMAIAYLLSSMVFGVYAGYLMAKELL